MELQRLKAIIEHRLALDCWYMEDSNEQDEARSVDALAKTILIELLNEERIRNGRDTT